ncbi:MAG TPA: hypothetical protein VF975_04140 [Thermoanaerobaculia bacterium]
MNIWKDVRQMANTADREFDNDEDNTLTEVGEEHDFVEIDEEADHPSDRRRDPLRIPH